MTQMKKFEMPQPKNRQPFSLEKKEKTNWKRAESAEYTRLHTSTRWQKIRDLQLTEFPLCYFCDHPATQVHRINPKDFSLFFERSNHASLCEDCHKKINKAYRRGISIEILFPNKENPTCLVQKAAPAVITAKRTNIN